MPTNSGYHPLLCHVSAQVFSFIFVLGKKKRKRGSRGISEAYYRVHSNIMKSSDINWIYGGGGGSEIV